MTTSNPSAVRLRAVEPSDWAWMYDLENRPDALLHGNGQAPMSADMLRQYASNYEANPFHDGQLRLVIEHEGRPAGTVDLFELTARHRRGAVGIYVAPESRGLGIGEEALRQLEDYSARILGLHQLSAVVACGNQPALRLFQKAGFRETGRLKEWIFSHPGFSDAILLTKILA